MEEAVVNDWLEIAAWLVFLLPLASFVLIVAFIRPFFNRFAEVAGQITIGAIAIAFALSLALFVEVVNNGGRQIGWTGHEWLVVGEFDLSMGIFMDALTAVMLVVVTGVSLLVQVYSTGYMKGDPGYARYFAYMSFFTASMVGLVVASNVIQLFVFWELVGLSSYLLIGFWYHKPSAAAAAKKAFLVTRLGDFGFLLAIFYLFFNGGTFTAAGLDPLDIPDIHEAMSMGLIAPGVAMWIALGLFAGAVGKSGQFPLHTWLPDAMEGPTPVSSLIHAATMVAAGVFLVARFFPVFEASEIALNTVAIIGGITAVLAATMGLVMNDVKRVLAYSTVSQLGYMMLALGVGAPGVAIFHLFTHAFFKCLLFMGAGSVSHATGGTFDMRFMGGLRGHMRWTYITFLIGSLSLAGIFPLAGFWSKDEILAYAFGQEGAVPQVVFLLAVIAVFMTAFYMFRALFMVFEGEYKGGADADPEAESHGPSDHPHESPNSMVGPMGVLAVFAVVAGLFASPIIDLGPIPKHWLVHDFLHSDGADFNIAIAAGSTLLALAGILLAYLMYYSRQVSAERVGSVFRPLYVLFSRKYYFDELYERVLTDRLFYRGAVRALDWFDRSIVDGAVRLVDQFGRNVGRGIAQAQTGQVQGYGMAVSVGVLAILGAYLLFK
ncbi:MAG: NADH-quinone oxidoreductase subunit L [Dehalococcoidia bacterium]|nr:NADH-quinone oxidoreductase subunit L [Dehalococcoidia bacterium]